MSAAGRLRERVAFDEPVQAPTGDGGTVTGWSEPPVSHECRAEFIYARGSEAIDAARLTGRSIYKVRIRSSQAARRITSAWRMRDVHRDVEYQVREVDAITDRHWIYVVVESGVAV